MTTYQTSDFNSPAPADPRNGLITRFVKHTVGTAITTSDTLKVAKLPKGAQILPALTSVFADADPDSANNLTLALKITDGTTTKTIIAASAFQAIDTRISPSAADITGLGFFKTGNDDYYAYLEPAVGDLDAAAVIFVELTYTMDASKDASTS